MSAVAKVFSAIASVVAVVSQVLFFVTGNPLFLTIAAVATAAAALATAVAIATQKPPDMKGALNQVVIGANLPVPYAMGRTFVPGMMVYDDSNGSNNVDRTQIFIGSVAGPIEGFEAFKVDFATVPFSLTSGGQIRGVATDSWYGADDGYLWVNSRLGLKPETALTPFAGRSAFRAWGTANKLSGMAAWSATMEFDEDGKRWSGGIPAWGMVAKWVKNYDPRKDGTYPGGAGMQRWDDEDTWDFGAGGTGFIAQGENPALHALAYARGRFIAGHKVVGVGLNDNQINIARFVEAANLCDANSWKLGGTVYEGPGISKWDNLKRICAAFGAKPLWSGGRLDLKLSRPVVALDTITAADLAADGVTVPAMKGWRDRINTIVARVRSEAHRWDYVQLDPVSEPTYVLEDGETKTKEIQYDLVQWNNQGAQLAAYEVVNAREYGPIQLTVKPRFLPFRLGEALNLDLGSLLDDPSLGVQPAIILSRSVDPGTGAIRLTLESETGAKHAWALTRAGVAPPSPTILDAGAIDQAVSDVNLTVAQVTQLIASSSPKNLTFSVSTSGVFNISNHDRAYADKTVAVTGNASFSSGGASGDAVLVYYDDPTRAGGAVTYQALVLASGAGEVSTAYPSVDHPYRHFVCARTIPASGSSAGGSGAGSGGGTGGGGIGGDGGIEHEL